MVTDRPLGHPTPTIHERYPATAPRGNFWLLGFPPGPVRSALGDLELSPSGVSTISTPCLARTPDQHVQTKDASPSVDDFHHPASKQLDYRRTPPRPAKHAAHFQPKQLRHPLAIFYTHHYSTRFSRIPFYCSLPRRQ